MVKQRIKAFVFLLFLAVFCLINSCNIDLVGLVESNDLNERLKERNNLKFLESKNWTALSLGDTYSFLVVTDTHIEDGKAWGLEKLNPVIAANTDIKFAVFLGDITQFGSTKDINRFMEIADQWTIPYYPVIGNHDIYFDNWPVWKKKIGSTNYRIDGVGATLLILDTANSFIGKDQLDWLERELKTAKGRVFVFTHSPLFVTGPADMQQITDIKERARIVSILHNKCDIVFAGHAHKEFYNKVGNVQYVTLEDFKGKKTYCLVTVTSGGVSYKIQKL